MENWRWLVYVVASVFLAVVLMVGSSLAFGHGSDTRPVVEGVKGHYPGPFTLYYDDGSSRRYPTLSVRLANECDLVPAVRACKAAIYAQQSMLSVLQHSLSAKGVNDIPG